MIMSVMMGMETPDASVAANIKKYSTVWDSIINAGRSDLFNSNNFSPNVVFHSKPANIKFTYREHLWGKRPADKTLDL